MVSTIVSFVTLPKPIVTSGVVELLAMSSLSADAVIGSVELNMNIKVNMSVLILFIKCFLSFDT